MADDSKPPIAPGFNRKSELQLSDRFPDPQELGQAARITRKADAAEKNAESYRDKRLYAEKAKAYESREDNGGKENQDKPTKPNPEYRPEQHFRPDGMPQIQDKGSSGRNGDGGNNGNERNIIDKFEGRLARIDRAKENQFKGIEREREARRAAIMMIRKGRKRFNEQGIGR